MYCFFLATYFSNNTTNLNNRLVIKKYFIFFLKESFLLGYKIVCFKEKRKKKLVTHRNEFKIYLKIFVLEHFSSRKMKSTFDSSIFIRIRSMNSVFSNRSSKHFTNSSFCSISRICSTD